MEFNLILPPVLGFLGLLVAFLLFLLVMRFDGGSDEVKKIGDQIHLGAMVFMSSEYKRLAIFCLICIVALYFFINFDFNLHMILDDLGTVLYHLECAPWVKLG